jgi:hypothetical protein
LRLISGMWLKSALWSYHFSQRPFLNLQIDILDFPEFRTLFV